MRGAAASQDDLNSLNEIKESAQIRLDAYEQLLKQIAEFNVDDTSHNNLMSAKEIAAIATRAVTADNEYVDLLRKKFPDTGF